MMFSSRLPFDLAPNRLTATLARERASGAAILDLTNSNPTRCGFDYPRDLLGDLSDAGSLVYNPHPLGAPAARAAVATDFARRGLDVPVDRIVLTAGTSEAYSILFKLLCDAGDEVLVPRPSYPLFEHLARLDQVVARPYTLEYHGIWSVDLASVARACSPRTRAVIVVSPNNPTGSFLKRAELDALAALCRAHSLALVADEVFADYPLADVPHRAPGVATCHDVLGFSLGGLSKSAGLPQLKLGWMAVSGPDPLVGQALTRLEVICDAYLSVATPTERAARALIAEGAEIREQIAGRIASNYSMLLTAARDHPSCDVLAVEGGWSAVIRVPATRPEESLALELLELDHVLVYPGYFFDFPREAFLIVSLLPQVHEFDEGVRRVFARVER